jgi:3-hydroxyisobutyrate dehydrogenase-like beta-hydroxyacid dehydrogenase
MLRAQAMTRCDLNLGFIGLGAIGLPMATNLCQAGVPLAVHSRSRHAETAPGLQGARPCASPAEAAEAADVLLICVSDDAAVETVLFGADGAAAALRPGSVVVDCSTIAPATAIACAERLARKGISYLDAPVTGGTEGAKAGTLTLLVGGEPEALERTRPILEVIGGTIHHFGPVGRGQQVKAVNQVLVAGSYAAVAEAMALGERLDLPMDQVVEALKHGAAGSWALEHRAPGMLAGRYPLGFKLALHHKDLGIALDAAKNMQLELPISNLVQQLEEGLMQQGHGDEDVSALHRQFRTKS